MITITDDPYYVVPPVTEKTPQNRFVLLHLILLSRDEWLAVPNICFTGGEQKLFQWNGINVCKGPSYGGIYSLDIWQNSPSGTSFCDLLINTFHVEFSPESNWQCTVYIIQSKEELLSVLHDIGITPESNAYRPIVSRCKETYVV